LIRVLLNINQSINQCFTAWCHASVASDVALSVCHHPV